jgi:hypothetical protein
MDRKSSYNKLIQKVQRLEKELETKAQSVEGIHTENAMYMLLETIPGCIAMILKKDTREIVASNQVAKDIGAVPGRTCFEACVSRDINCSWCLAPIYPNPPCSPGLTQWKPAVPIPPCPLSE